MRLRSLRRLEEMEIRKEHKSPYEGTQGPAHAAGATTSCAGCGSPRNWRTSARNSAPARWATGAPNWASRRAAVDVELRTPSSSARRSPSSCRRRAGSGRSKGAVADPGELKFKEGDKLRLLLPCQTTDRLTLFATNGKAFTLKAADLPRGRGDGQPVRLLAELPNEDDVAALFVAVEGTRYLVASNTGRGFIVPAGELSAEKRTGKQMLNLKPGEEAALCVPGRWRSCRGHRREPPAAGVPAGSGAGNGARCRGDPATLQGRRSVRCEGVPSRRRADLEAGRAGSHRDRSAPLAGRTGHGGPDAAERVPEIAKIRGVV